MKNTNTTLTLDKATEKTKAINTKNTDTEIKMTKTQHHLALISKKLGLCSSIYQR